MPRNPRLSLCVTCVAVERSDCRSQAGCSACATTPNPVRTLKTRMDPTGRKTFRAAEPNPNTRGLEHAPACPPTARPPTAVPRGPWICAPPSLPAPALSSPPRPKPHSACLPSWLGVSWRTSPFRPVQLPSLLQCTAVPLGCHKNDARAQQGAAQAMSEPELDGLDSAGLTLPPSRAARDRI